MSPGAISKIESGESAGRSSSIKAYVEALRILSSNPPLKQKHAQILLDLHRYSKDRSGLEFNFAAVNFGDIVREGRPEELSDLVALLEREDGPAFIMDDLWFIHAINGAALLLYEVDPHGDFVYRWEGWHSLAAKFLDDSPVREKHPKPTNFFPQIITSFLEERRTYRYLFTIQMRILICRMLKLSIEEVFELQNWWGQASSFILPFEIDMLSRNLKYQEGFIQVDASNLYHREVEVYEGYPVNYTLAAWNPRGTDARNAFNAISKKKMSHELFFAADYDKNHDFHVNAWEEVKTHLS